MPETARLCLVLLGAGVLVLVLIVAASPWLCRLRIDQEAVREALSGTENDDRRASDCEAA